MPHTRRTFLAAVGAAVTGTTLPKVLLGAEQSPTKKHIVTLSFDDGFSLYVKRSEDSPEAALANTVRLCKS